MCVCDRNMNANINSSSHSGIGYRAGVCGYDELSTLVKDVRGLACVCTCLDALVN